MNYYGFKHEPLKMTTRERIDLIDHDLFFFRYAPEYHDLSLALTADTYCEAAERLLGIIEHTNPEPHNFHAERILNALRTIAENAAERHAASRGKGIELKAREAATFSAARYYQAQRKLADLSRQYAETTGEDQEATQSRNRAQRLDDDAKRYKEKSPYLNADREYYFSV